VDHWFYHSAILNRKSHLFPAFVPQNYASRQLTAVLSSGPMTDTGSTDLTPQSVAAEPDAPAGDICAECKTPITGRYYRDANFSMVCGNCFDRIQGEKPRESHAAFMRAVLAGLVGFAIGLIVYASFEIITGVSIGYLALAVGWIVGKAMMIGSGGIGGRRYQLTAILLTYAAVSMAFIPLVLSVMIKKSVDDRRHIVRQAPENQKTGQADAAPPPAQQAPDPTTENSAEKPRMGLFRAFGTLALMGLISPFLELQEGFNGILGLVILLVGMQFAWKMTAGSPKTTLEGPYELNPSTSDADWRPRQ
jgi:hypothetical protein